MPQKLPSHVTPCDRTGPPCHQHRHLPRCPAHPPLPHPRITKSWDVWEGTPGITQCHRLPRAGTSSIILECSEPGVQPGLGHFQPQILWEFHPTALGAVPGRELGPHDGWGRGQGQGQGQGGATALPSSSCSLCHGKSLRFSGIFSPGLRKEHFIESICE